MKFLLVVFAFTLHPATGEVADFQVLKQPFDTLAECNYAGANFRELTKTTDPKFDVVKTLSYCVRPEDFYN